MKCPDCGVDYPELILSPLFINGDYTEPMCGICAAIHMNRRSFTGNAAEYNRLAAVEHRKNTNQKPKRG